VGKAAQSIAATINIEKRLSELDEEELIELRRRYLGLPAPVVIDLEPEKDDTPELRQMEMTLFPSNQRMSFILGSLGQDLEKEKRRPELTGSRRRSGAC
jgi:hypothetical protein